MSRRRPSDRGATIVEAAFVLPLMLAFIFGLVDLGMWTFNSNQATNAARDGARVGILYFEEADDGSGAPDFDRIEDAVRSHLTDEDLADFEISVRCEQPSGLAIDCSVATVDVDRIQVDVEWTWPLVTPVATAIGFDEGISRGSATMTLVGLPVGGSSTPPPAEDPDPEPPATCSISLLTVNPATVVAKSNQLTSPLDIDFTTNGSAGCTDLAIRLTGTKNNPTTITQPCGCQTDDQHGTPNYGWVYSGSDNIWQSGRYGYVDIMNGSTSIKTFKFWVG